MPLISLKPTLSPSRRLALLLPLVIAASAPFAAQAQNPAVVPLPFVTTVAGIALGSSNTQCDSSTDIPNNAGVHLGDGCLPTQANLVTIYGSFTDAAGNIYITENGTNNDIRVIYKGGAVLTKLLIASSVAIPNFTPIPGRIYTLAGARSATITVKNGSKFSCNGQTTGPVALDSSGDGCPGTEAYIKPRGMFVDPSGNVFLVSTGGGNGVKVLYAGGTQVASLITAENPGVTPQLGFVYQLAGQSSPSYSGNGALAKSSALVVIRDIIVDSNDNVYISDGNTTAVSGNSVRVIYGGVAPPPGIANPTLGFIYAFAGAAGCTSGSASCTASDAGDGGPATAAFLNGPYNLVFDRFSNLYIAEIIGDRVRVVYAGGTIPGISNPVAGDIYTYAGGGTLTANGTPANQVKFGTVDVNGIDASGNVYVEDGTSKVLWRFDATTGIGYVIAGHSSGATPAAGTFCSGTAGPKSVDNFGDGCPAINGAISDTGRVSFDPQGNFYVGENGNGVVREFSFNTQFPAINVGSSTTQPLAFQALSATTLATEQFSQTGAATTEFSDAGNGTCTATSALTALQVCVFNVAFTPAHDGLRTATQQLSTASAILTTSLLSGLGVSADLAVDPATQISAGAGLAPSGILTDLRGNIYVADTTGNQVLEGFIPSTTLSPIVTGLNKPHGLAIDTANNLYIADTGNNRIATVNLSTTAPTVVTFAASLNAPQGVAVDAFGNVWIADTGNNRVVEVTPSGVQVPPSAVPLTGLNAPTQLTFDSLGNLYIVDSGNSRIVELPVNGSQTTITLPAGLIPTAIAVDPSGTLYVTDSASLQLLAFEPGATVGTAFLTGLIKPAGLAVDPDGNLLVADAGVPSVTELQRSLGNITFPITNVNQSSTSSINVTNVGNANLNFPTASLATLTGSQEFTLASATTNGCATGTTYTPGLGCNFTATFAPTARGAVTATATFNTNATNAASAVLSGNGQQLVTTSTTLAITSPTGTITYGQAVVLTATVTPTSNAGAPTGTVVFTVDGRAQTPLPYGTGTYKLTLNPTVATHIVSVAFSGDANYASSSANTSFTVGQAVTTTTLAVVPQNSNGIISLVFNATVASATATGETGTVTFFAGTQTIATVALSASRTASTTTAALSFPSNSFTAVYSGDANFAGSTSAAIASAGDFAIGSFSTSVSIPQGGIAQVIYVIDSLYGGTGTITPTCSGLPMNSVCRFQPTTITLGGVTQVAMDIYTNVNPSLASNERLSRGQEVFLATLFPLSFGLLAFTRRSRRLRLASLLCFAVLFSMFPIAGCGDGAGSTAATGNQGFVTPPGTSTVTVTFTGTAPLATQTTSFPFTVVANNTTF
jgi:sugar lactone lactonase YvrE